MLNDLDLANLCHASYFESEAFSSVIDLDGVYVGLKEYEDCWAVVFRGSTTMLDWLRDFQGVMVNDPTLGWVEMGFMRGMRDIKARLDITIPFEKPVYITGHSLGAARALLFAGLWANSGEITEAVVTFGSPRPAGSMLSQILSAEKVRCYKNGDDPVCDVPLDIPVLEPYIHPTPLIPVDAAPEIDDLWGVLARHHIELYQKAMEGLTHG